MPTPRKSAAPTPDTATNDATTQPGPSKDDAAANAANETQFDPNAEVKFDFRGTEMTIQNSATTSFRFQMARAAGDEPRLIFELLGPVQAGRLLDLVKPGEEFYDVAIEIFDAYGKASGSGNS